MHQANPTQAAQGDAERDILHDARIGIAAADGQQIPALEEHRARASVSNSRRAREKRLTPYIGTEVMTRRNPSPAC